MMKPKTIAEHHAFFLNQFKIYVGLPFANKQVHHNNLFISSQNKKQANRLEVCLLFRNFAGMNDVVTLFHGSNVVVERPQILVSGFYKDFGYGFYCTNIEKQAKKWAMAKKGKQLLTKGVSAYDKCIFSR